MPQFIIYATIEGECCDYGWGTPGNAKFAVIQVADMAAARAYALEHFLTFSRRLHDELQTSKTISIFEYVAKEELNVAGAITQRRAEETAEKAKKDAEAKEAHDRAEFARLQAKFGSKS